QPRCSRSDRALIAAFFRAHPRHLPAPMTAIIGAVRDLADAGFMRSKWIAFGSVVAASFTVLLAVGVRIYQQAPPIPREVVTADGGVVITGEDIRAGQNVWQSMGGMEMGSIWGHGSYVAPDWTADWLHRELTFILDDWARRESAPSYDALPAE